jgi:hypothetical protein
MRREHKSTIPRMALQELFESDASDVQTLDATTSASPEGKASTTPQIQRIMMPEAYSSCHQTWWSLTIPPRPHTSPSTRLQCPAVNRPSNTPKSRQKRAHRAPNATTTRQTGLEHGRRARRIQGYTKGSTLPKPPHHLTDPPSPTTHTPHPSPAARSHPKRPQHIPGCSSKPQQSPNTPLDTSGAPQGAPDVSPFTNSLSTNHHSLNAIIARQ